MSLASSATILIIESDPEVRKHAEGVLRSARYDVTSAPHCLEALDTAKEVRPDVILLDVTGTGSDALNLCRLMKSDPALPNPFVVHISKQSSIPGVFKGPDCADGNLVWPFNDQALLLCIGSLLRVKEAQEKLRRYEQLWRTVFLRTRDAVLIVDGQLHITDANPKAAELYGYPGDELKQKRLQDLCPAEAIAEFERQLAGRSEAQSFLVRSDQCKKDGTVFRAELQAREFLTSGKPCFEIIVWDLNDGTAVNGGSHDGERELELLSHYSPAAEPSIAASLYGGGPLSHSASSTFEELCTQYSQTFDLRIEHSMYEVEGRLSEHLRGLAGRLGRLRAGPRDVVELHATVLKKKLATDNLQKRRQYNDEGRFMLLEVMGYLADYYRDRSFGSRSTGRDV